MAVTIGITGVDIAESGDIIEADDIRTVLETETALYTNVRKQNAVLNVTGGGGNTGSRPTAGVVFNSTEIAHLRTSVRQTLSAISGAGVTTGDIVNDGNLETYFGRIATEYSSQANNVVTDTIDVCHASCHSSCHGSRGRR
mgnify:CR=1 FL=1|jgi:hypothetical protein